MSSPRYLLDTDTLSNLTSRSHQFPDLKAKIGSQPEGAIATCVVVALEMIDGVNLKLQRELNPERVITFYKLASTILNVLGSLPILPFDAAAAAEYRKLPSTQGRRDRRIAAIALSSGLIVVTRNVDHFDRMHGLTVEDWTNG